MKKKRVLQIIAQQGYNIGLGAKKHFSTYDIVEKVNGWINFISISLGILGLVFDFLSTNFFSSVILIMGIMALYVSHYDTDKEEYNKIGKLLTEHFYNLQILYLKIKDDATYKEDDEYPNEKYETELNNIIKSFSENSISKQIAFSNWFAHYKFFFECSNNSMWVVDELKLRFWKDKIPAIFRLIIFVMIIIVLVLSVYRVTSIITDCIIKTVCKLC